MIGMKSYNSVFVRIFATVAIANFSLASVCAKVTKNQNPILPRWTWTQEKWTGNDLPYKQTREHLDRLFRHGNLNKSLVQNYKKIALANPLNARYQFRWAYAIYKLASAGSPFGNQELAQAGRYLPFAPSPHTYNYSRLRFLIEARSFPYRQLRAVGERLLRQKTVDPEVKFQLLNILDPGRSSAEKREALTLAYDLVRSSPARPSVYSSLGGVYYR